MLHTPPRTPTWRRGRGVRALGIVAILCSLSGTARGSGVDFDDDALSPFSGEQPASVAILITRCENEKDCQLNSEKIIWQRTDASRHLLEILEHHKMYYN